MTPELWVSIITTIVVPVLVRVTAHYLPWIVKDVPGTDLDDSLNGGG